MNYRQQAHKHFLLAKDKLKDTPDEYLLYVALDVRLCIENLVYYRATMYRDALEEIDLSKVWQPRKIIEAMYEVDNKADQDFILTINIDEKSFTANFKTISMQYLKKNYHKLGNMLHAENLNQSEPVDFLKRRKQLNDCVSYLDDFFKAELTNVRLKSNQTFNCFNCGVLINRNVTLTPRASYIVNCLKCEAGHNMIFSEDGKQFSVIPRSTNFECKACSTSNILFHSHIKIGNIFQCGGCNLEYSVMYTLSPSS